MSIDLTIEGDPRGIFELATWLDSKVSVPSNELRRQIRRAGNESRDCWKGLTGKGFRDATDAIAAAIDPVDVYAADAAVVLRAYARRIERGRGTFADYIDEGCAARLHVNGNILDMPERPTVYIAAPGAPNPYAKGPSGQCIDLITGEEYEEAERVYARIAEKVDSWWTDLEDWLIEHMVPLIGRATDFDLLTAAYEALKRGNEAIRGFPVGLSEAVWATNLESCERKLKETQAARDSLARRRRSGNPAVREPAKASDAARLRGEAETLARDARALKAGKTLLGAGGAGIEIIAAGVEIANGGSWTSATVGAVGTVAGGAAAGAAAGALLVECPPIGIAAIVGFAGYGVGELSKGIWSLLVPLDKREALDAWDFGYVFR